METQTNETVQVEEVKNLTFSEKLKYFFTNPNKLFESYDVKPTLLVKLLILLVLTVTYAFLLMNLVAEPMMDMLKQTPGLAQEQIALAAKIASITLVVASIITVIAAIFIVPLIYWGLLSLFGGKTSYKKVAAVYSLAYIPCIIGSIVTLGIAFYTNNFDGLLEPKMTNILFNRLNLFVIWQALLLVFGFAKIAKLKLSKSAIIVGIMWLIATGFGIISVL